MNRVDVPSSGHSGTIRVVQNCFLPEQLPGCTFEPYLNALPEVPDERYLFFESDVIRRLVEGRWHVGHDWFGVLGHRFQAKLDEACSWGSPLRNTSRGAVDRLTIERFVERDPPADFISLGRFCPHPVFRVADGIHPGIFAATSRLLESIGVRFDLRRASAQPIYFNSFVGRRLAMEAYVRDLLSPVIHAATHDESVRQLCLRDAGYRHAFPKSLREVFALDHYPLHPFIGERLINVYVLLAGARVESIDGGGARGNVANVLAAGRSAVQAIRCRVDLWRRGL